MFRSSPFTALELALFRSMLPTPWAGSSPFAGPVQDQDYSDIEIATRLTADITWLGPLDAQLFRRLYANSNVGVLAPTWEELFGLVAAGMLSCGLPIAAIDRGAIGEFTDPSVAVLTTGGIGHLAGAIRTAARLDRVACRRFAPATLSLSVRQSRPSSIEATTVAWISGRRGTTLP